MITPKADLLHIAIPGNGEGGYGMAGDYR